MASSRMVTKGRPNPGVAKPATARRASTSAKKPTGTARPAGGSKSRSEPKPLVLRVPPEVLDRVERLAELRRPSVSRHHWLLEAVYEKLEREDSREDD